MSLPPPARGVRRSLESRQIDRFVAQSATGVNHTVIERIYITHVILPDRSRQSTPGANSYQTTSGLAVSKLSEVLFRIEGTGELLTRL